MIEAVRNICHRDSRRHIFLAFDFLRKYLVACGGNQLFVFPYLWDSEAHEMLLRFSLLVFLM